MNKQFAFVFPGQGSQKLGMLATFSEESIVKDTFAQASQILNQDIWQLCQQGPESQLNETQWTQPALLTASVALWRLWQQQTQLIPHVMAGHSLGEYSALVCAGSLPFQQALLLVQKRGQLMQQAVPQGQGAMAAILGLTKDQVISLCQQIQEDICEAVNFNAPLQTVVAGHTQAVEKLVVLAKEAGAKRAMKLPVSVPSHCALMQPAAQQLSDYIDSQDIHFTQPELPIYHNVDVQPHESHDAIKKALVAQLAQPVRWVETIAKIKQSGTSYFVESGPGKVLGGLIKRIDSDCQAFSLETNTQFDDTKQQLTINE